MPPLQVDPREPSGASRTTTIADRPLFVTPVLDGGSCASQSAEDGEGIAGRDLVDELSAGLDLAVEPLREGLRVLLAEGFHRSSYFTLPLVLASLSFVGTLVFIRFLGDRWL